MIVVVRHGETALNTARILQPPHVPLNARGERQAEHVGKRVAELGIAALISSDLLRARMTADAIARHTGLAVVLEPLLAERNFGDLRGKHYSEVGPDLFAPGFRPPGGEDMATFDARVAEVWSRVLQAAARTDGHLAIVTHGLVCGSIVRQFLALESGAAVPGRFGNTSVTICEPAPPHRVHTLNCVAHLIGTQDAADGDAPSGL